MTDLNVREEYCLVFGITTILVPYIKSPSHVFVMKQIMRDTFPQTARPLASLASEHDLALANAIQEQLATDGYQSHPEHVKKVRNLK
jgi:hypothetical protein